MGGDRDGRYYYAIHHQAMVFANPVPDHVIIRRMFPLPAGHTIVE